MRIHRLLTIILLLQNHDKLSASELATRLEVSPRTILRDMETLSAAAIPVYAERGRHGGWALLDSYRQRLHNFTEAEINALMLTPPNVLSDLGWSEAADVATLKFFTNLPNLKGDDSQRVRERIHIDGAAWHSYNEDKTHLTQLQDAIWHDQQLTITYYRYRAEETVQRTVNPLGLVAKGRSWYLVAQVEDDFRTYRVSRILDMSLTGQIITRPAEFDLADYWQSFTTQFVSQLPSYPVKLHIHNSAIRLIEAWRWTKIQSNTSLADDWYELIVDFEEIHGAIAAICSCGGLVRIIEPIELEAAVKAHISKLAQVYDIAPK